jgi:hypothetical protein
MGILVTPPTSPVPLPFSPASFFFILPPDSPPPCFGHPPLPPILFPESPGFRIGAQ